MLDAAQKGSYAYPAINCTSIVTLNAAFKAFADMKSDGIIQFSTGAGQFASGLNNKDATKGTIILAEVAHRLAEQYDVLVGLNTDHCQPKAADTFLKPLIEATAARRARGGVLGLGRRRAAAADEHDGVYVKHPRRGVGGVKVPRPRAEEHEQSAERRVARARRAAWRSGPCST